MSISETENLVPATRAKILVIDDEAVIGLSCTRVLSPEGYEVTFHEDSRAGLRAGLSGEFDVILLDLMMPGIDGMGLLGQFKAAGVSSEVVIVTGHATVESAVEAMKLGAADYLTKPFYAEPVEVAGAKGVRALRASARERRACAASWRSIAASRGFSAPARRCSGSSP